MWQVFRMLKHERGYLGDDRGTSGLNDEVS